MDPTAQQLKVNPTSMVCQVKVKAVAMMREETGLTDRDHQLGLRLTPLEPRWEPLELPDAGERDVEVIEDTTAGDLEISVKKSSKALAQSILACSRQIAAMGADLNQAMEGYNEGRLELVKSLGSIKEQLALHAHAATAMSSTVTHQSNEVKKLLAAFGQVQFHSQMVVERQQYP